MCVCVCGGLGVVTRRLYPEFLICLIFEKSLIVPGSCVPQPPQGAGGMAPKHPRSLPVTFGPANQRVYLEGEHLALFVQGQSGSHKEVFIHFHLEQNVMKR